MIFLILAGTEDGRLLAEKFQEKGHQVILSTLTEYGKEIAQEQGLQARSGALNEESLRWLLFEKKIEGLIDATHPYAQNIRQLALKVAQDTGTPYFRWERPVGNYPEDPLIHFAKDLEEAGKLAGKLGKKVFLSTGSRTLAQFMRHEELAESELFVRVLPKADIIKECEELGLKPYQIVAMQGPFTEKLNQALWEQLKIDVVITKESGAVGGTMEKVQSCLNIGIPIVIWQRPQSLKFNKETNPGVKISRGEGPPEIELQKAFENFVREVEKSLEY